MQNIFDLQKKAQESCQTKCLDTNFQNTRMYKGEVICLDKCLHKYLNFQQSFQKLSEKIVKEESDRMQAEMDLQNSYVEKKEGMLAQVVERMLGSKSKS